MRRRHLLGCLLDGKTGRAFMGSSLGDVQRRQAIKRADFLAYERKMQRRETMRLVAAICLGSVVAALMIASIIALVSARMP